MNFNPRKLFVIVGYPHSGKTRTIQQIFKRKRFFPFKRPIQAPAFGNEQFVVINISDHNHRTADYLERIKSIMQFHMEALASFLVIISLAFDNSARDVKEILAYFNPSGFQIHYLVLYSSWNDKVVVSDADMDLLAQEIENGTIHLLDRLVTKSELRFKERAEDVEVLMRAILEGKKGDRPV